MWLRGCFSTTAQALRGEPLYAPYHVACLLRLLCHVWWLAAWCLVPCPFDKLLLLEVGCTALQQSVKMLAPCAGGGSTAPTIAAWHVAREVLQLLRQWREVHMVAGWHAGMQLTSLCRLGRLQSPLTGAAVGRSACHGSQHCDSHAQQARGAATVLTL